MINALVQPSIPPAGASLLPAGKVVGKAYRIVSALAEGGMGVVYEAEQLATGAHRALKVMHAHFTHDETLRARFVREARLAASIPSDHVAHIVDAGDDQETGCLYIVMELLHGTTLSREVRRRGAFAWPDALEVLRQIAHALGAAHAMGIVHRDLKPANVFLATSRNASGAVTVKVLDFGIAKAISGSIESTGALLGTPSWMAPEQTTTDVPIGPATDVWGFGLLAYLLLTGKHYFPSANLANATPGVLLREIVIEPLAAASTRANGMERGDLLPGGFDAWFARCVDRDPSARFPDARAAYEGLARLAAPTPQHAPASFAEDPPSAATPPRPWHEAETSAAGPQGSRSRGVPALTAPTRQETPATSPARRRGGRAALPAALAVACAIGAAVFFASRHSATPPLPAPAVGAGTAPDAVSQPIVRLHGSNTIGSDLGPALAEAFLRHRTGSLVLRKREAQDVFLVEARDDDRLLESIEIEGHGTATAFEDLLLGRCDIGMASRRINDDELARLAPAGNLKSAASEHVVGLDGIAVIVNPANRVVALTETALGAIFAGKTTSWAEVGGADGPITVYARDDRSGTFDTFRHLVLRGQTLSPGAKRFESSEDLSDAVAADPHGIGFISLHYVRSAKAVMVRQSPSSPPVLPTNLSIATEDYPLSRRLYLYLPTTCPVVARDFVDYALSDDGQKVIESVGFVSLRPTCEADPAPCTTCSPQYRDAVKGACRMSVDFRFDHGQLDTRALRDLERLAGFVRQPANQSKSMVLVAFAAATGSRADDLAASQKLADMAADQLRARGLRVASARGMGAEAGIVDGTPLETRDHDNRVEVWLR